MKSTRVGCPTGRDWDRGVRRGRPTRSTRATVRRGVMPRGHNPSSAERGTNSAQLKGPRMWIETKTRPAKCRHCGAVILWATRANGRVIAFDPPIVTVAALWSAPADLIDVDIRHTRRHVNTCAAFDPPLSVGHTRRRHV